MSRSFVAEIIGPAGSGKTTLSRLLKQRKDVRCGLSVWRLPLRVLLPTAFSSLPDLIALYRLKHFEWDHFKLLIQQKGLLRLIRTESTRGYRALVLDEGLVFALAKLRAFGPQKPDLLDSDRWMQSLFNQLAPALDAIIWLDASDAELARRIRERAKPHRMKSSSDAEIEKHLSMYRNSFERVVAELSRRNGLRVFKYSTDEVTLEQIADHFLVEAHAGN